MSGLLSTLSRLAFGQSLPKPTPTRIAVVPQTIGQPLLAWLDNSNSLHYQGTALASSLKSRTDFAGLTLFCDQLYLLTQDGGLYLENGHRFPLDVVHIEATTRAQSMTLQLRGGKWVKYGSPEELDGTQRPHFPLRKPPTADHLSVAGLGTPNYVNDGKARVRLFEQPWNVEGNTNLVCTPIVGVRPLHDGRRLYETQIAGGPYWKAGHDQHGFGHFFVAERSVTVATDVIGRREDDSDAEEDECCCEHGTVGMELTIIEAPLAIMDAQSFAISFGKPESQMVPLALLLTDGTLYLSQLPPTKCNVKLPKKITHMHVQGEDGMALIFEDQTAGFYLLVAGELVEQQHPPRPSRRHFAGHE